jgi:hypothetical protein
MTRLVELLKDSRFYHFRTTGHWMQRALEACWPAMTATDKSTIFQCLKETEAAIDHGRAHAGRLALFVPQNELVSPLIEMAAEQRGKSGSEYAYLGERDHIYQVPMPEGEAYAYFFEGWSAAWPQEHLSVLARSSDDINRQNISPENLRAALMRIGNSVVALLPVIEANRAEFLSADGYKLVERIEQWLKRCWQSRMIVASPEVIGRLAEVSMVELETADYAVGEYVKDLSVIASSESSWSRALGFMALLFAFVPARTDESLRDRFTEVARAALAQEDKYVQALMTHGVNSNHWKSSPERTALYEELYWSTERDPLVTNATLQTLLFMPDDVRGRAFRIAYNRSPQNLPDQYAGNLGKALGLASFSLREQAQRTVVAKLTNEIIENPDHFAFLQPAEVRQECFREVAFGLSDQFKGVWALPEYAADYARWMLGIWRTLRARRIAGYQSEHIVSSVFFQLKDAQAVATNSPSKEKLKSLWEILRPFATAVAQDGTRPDLFYLFFALRDGEFKSVTPSNDLFEFVRIMLERLQNDVANHMILLEERDPAQEAMLLRPWIPCPSTIYCGTTSNESGATVC